MKILFASLLASIVALLAAVGGSNLQASSTPSDKGGPFGFDLAEMRKLIEANNARFTAAHLHGDQATIDNMFTIDAKCLPPGAHPVIGRDAIAKLTREYLETGVSEFREETTDFYGNEELLIDQGNYVMVYGKDMTRETGKYLNVWKKEAGIWKIYSNIWNTNAAAEPAK
jgi:ketosteroid isomerase-like protein